MTEKMEKTVRYIEKAWVSIKVPLILLLLTLPAWLPFFYLDFFYKRAICADLLPLAKFYYSRTEVRFLAYG